MALANLSRFALRPCLAARFTPTLKGMNSRLPIAPMATSAEGQMKEFWEKNQRLGRPNSPWTIYHMHLPMVTSLTHRITGIAMGVALYGIAIANFIAPGDFPSYVELLKSFELATPIWFSLKALCAFPLVYHYINGIRHLTWDAGIGLRLPTQYKTGSIIMASAMAISVLLASLAYL